MIYDWAKQLKAIFGYFWCHVWTLGWLLLAITTFFKAVVGNTILQTLKGLLRQLKVSNPVLQDFKVPCKILLPRALERASSLSLKAVKNFGFYIGVATGTGYTYTVLGLRDMPVSLSDKIIDANVTLLKDIDYTCYRDTISFNKALSEYGLATLVITRGTELILCYCLWAYVPKYSFLRDSFTAVLLLPEQWLYAYPQAVLTAWKIQLKGASQFLVSKLLGIISGCYVSLMEDIITHVNDTSIQTASGIVYNVRPGFISLVKQGDVVRKGQSIIGCTTSADTVGVYTSLPLFVLKIPILTLCGYLWANNIALTSLDNILPLQGLCLEQYRLLCVKRNNDMYIPYILIPKTLNTANWIFSKVWLNKGVCICIPSVFTLDMARALLFILNRLPKGAIPIVLQFNSATGKFDYTIKPSIISLGRIIDYYKTSINNKSSYKERNNDFTA